MSSTRLHHMIPTSLHTKLTQEANKRGVRVAQLLTQILMERYKTEPSEFRVGDLVFGDD